jgi:hypothetical protein
MSTPPSPTPLSNRLEVAISAWKFTQEANRNRNWDSRLVKSLGSFCSAFIQKETFSDWVNFLEQPENQPFQNANPFLRLRTLRGYMSTQWDNSKKLKVLKDSLRFAHIKKDLLLKSLIIDMADSLVIADIPSAMTKVIFNLNSLIVIVFVAKANGRCLFTAIKLAANFVPLLFRSKK